MADNPDARPPEGLIIPVSDTPHAPFIFYEIAPAFLHLGSRMELSTSLCRPIEPGLRTVKF
jgi:hypothetical protein